MPVFDFKCVGCGSEFEVLVRGTAVPVCPECGGVDLSKLISLPAIKSDGTRALAMKSARQRDARQGEERVRAQREYEANHD